MRHCANEHDGDGQRRESEELRNEVGEEDGRNDVQYVEAIVEVSDAESRHHKVQMLAEAWFRIEGVSMNKCEGVTCKNIYVSPIDATLHSGVFVYLSARFPLYILGNRLSNWQNFCVATFVEA